MATTDTAVPGADKAADRATAERLVREQFRVIETGDAALAAANMTDGYVNHQAGHEPLAARGRGPEALLATGAWLRRAFSEVSFEVHRVEVVGDRATAWVTMRGRHTGPFVRHDSPDGAVTDVFPPTGLAFASRQVHWFTIEDGAVSEHDAVRDDLGMARQAGWIPPSPSYVVQMKLARRRARRIQRRDERRAEQPGEGGAR
jgi:ketosteroid isomerase-like protein